ncbi:hypothetical protein Y1Q_0009223 [Alligator mississippiensis]|uniref:Uncharacterized protein n=1 Tax=Alligator mississippiensis TaxID=8496 RepID=A0A151M2W7_ALLMI|nr:hypothetical protein Y1Q_0009223 [Alligator mississippiensis]
MECPPGCRLQQVEIYDRDSSRSFCKFPHHCASILTRKISQGTHLMDHRMMIPVYCEPNRAPTILTRTTEQSSDSNE